MCDSAHMFCEVGWGGGVLAKTSATAAPMKPKKGAEAGHRSFDMMTSDCGAQHAASARRGRRAQGEEQHAFCSSCCEKGRTKRTWHSRDVALLFFFQQVLQEDLRLPTKPRKNSYLSYLTARFTLHDTYCADSCKLRAHARTHTRTHTHTGSETGGGA